VDVRPYLKSLLNELTSLMSKKKLTHELFGYQLVR